MIVPHDRPTTGQLPVLTDSIDDDTSGIPSGVTHGKRFASFDPYANRRELEQKPLTGCPERHPGHDKPIALLHDMDGSAVLAPIRIHTEGHVQTLKVRLPCRNGGNEDRRDNYCH
jgi:hypothetical protein